MEKAKIYYARVDEFWTKEQKLQHLESIDSFKDIKWKPIEPDAKYNWLLEGLHSEYEDFIPLGTKEVRAKPKNEYVSSTIFRSYSRGVATARDNWAYNFNLSELNTNMKKSIEFYNNHVLRWKNRESKDLKIEDFIVIDETRISWSRDIRQDIERGRYVELSKAKIRNSLYRPFTKSYLFFDRIMNEEIYGLCTIYPTESTEKENLCICTVSEAQIAFSAQVANCIPCLHYGGRQTQCFPL